MDDLSEAANDTTDSQCHDLVIRRSEGGVQHLPAVSEGRAETGPMQFGDDWPGVFIRGDNAGWHAMQLSQLLRAIDATDLVDPLTVMNIQELRDTLAGCVVGPSKDVIDAV